MKAKLVGIGAVMAIVAGILWLNRTRHSASQPFQLSYWFWQTPYSLTQVEQSTLKDMRVKQMFVRAGTFSSDGTNIVLMFPQKYTDGANAFQVHLVFNADAGVLRHFEDYDLKTIVPQIAQRMEQQVRAAEKSGVKVIGVQLDFDVATRLLPRYADLITKVRAAKPMFQRRPGFQFSMTGLMSWLGTNSLERLSNEVDFIIPQAYEGVTGKSPDEMRQVFDPEDLKRRLPQAERLNCPYWIGVPAYGHALLYDDHDHLIGTYRNLEAQDAIRHPSFQLKDAYPSDNEGKPAKDLQSWTGEEILKFRAIKPAASGYGKGFTLCYSLPTPRLLLRAANFVKSERGANCQGAVIYRMPEPESSFTIPLDAAVRAVAKKDSVPELKVECRFNPVAYEAIEGQHGDIPIDAYVEVTNTGRGSSFVAPDALDIRLEFDRPGFGEVRQRDFDGIRFGAINLQNSEDESDPKRATIIHLTKAFTYPGQKLYCGPIRLLNSGYVSVKIKSRIRLQSGVSWQESPTRETLISSSAGKHR